MAELVKCRTCKHPVDYEAHTCPQCGARGPVPVQESRSCAKVCLWIFVGLCVLAVVSAMTADPAERERRRTRSALASLDPEPEPAPTPETQPDPKPTTTVPQYTIVETEDVSYANIVRKSYRVRVPKQLTEAELTALSHKIVRQVTARERIKALMIFYYLPESDATGAYTAGRATWAPDGDWGKTDTYLAPKLVIDTGSAMGPMPKDAIVDLPLQIKQILFLHIVQKEDQGLDVGQSERAVAREFGITMDQAVKIGIEGLNKGWRMPRAGEVLPRPDVKQAIAAKFDTTKQASLAGADDLLATNLLVKADWKHAVIWLDLATWDNLTPATRANATRVFGFLKADKTGQSASLKLKASPDGPLLAICYKDGKPQLMRKQDRE
jgi:hypothetical protein